MTQVISIVRRHTELFALISKRVGGEEGGSEVAWARLAELKESIYPAKERLLDSWRRLGAITAVDEQTLYDLFVILLETVPDPSSSENVSPLPVEWNTVPVLPRATRAHPRAFKGTKFQPPKVGRLPQTDVRLHMCDAHSLRTLVSPLWKFLGRVRPRLVKAGYDDAALDAVAVECGPNATRSVPWNLPMQYLQYLWPSARLSPARDRSRLLSLFSALEMGADRQLLGAFARFAVVAGVETACLWGPVIQALPADRRVTFVEKLIGVRASRRSPIANSAAHVEEASSLASDEQFPVWIEHLLLVMHRDSSADYLLAGFRLSTQFNPKHRFGEIGQCVNFPEQDVEEIGISLDEHNWLALALWERCGRLPGFAELIRGSRWRSFAPEAARSYFRFLVGIVYFDIPEQAIQKKWAGVAEDIPKVEAMLLATPPEHQEKFVECVSDWLSCWDDPATVRRCLGRGFQLLRRLAAPPFKTGANIDRATMHFLELEDEPNLQRFLAAPNACFQSFEAACRRDTDAVLIARGLKQLTRLQGRFTVDSFLAKPNRLFRTAKMLGSVSAPVRAQIIKKCQEHLFFRIDALKAPVEKVCEEIAANLRGRQENPIPAQLSSWLRGEIELSQARRERYKRVLAERLMLTQLALIEESVVDWLKRGLPARQTTKSGEHALRLLGTLRENRRGLRKFLNAYWAGDQQYLSKHPATLAWYRRHKTVPHNVWEQGISFRSGKYSIEVERDPFEVLKLGTYVGSCLAIGGMCSDSAVAALLDANKRVLYARDDRNQVIARQLVAISDQDSLVCFSVYPLSASKEIKALFKEYDQAFSTALGLPLYRPTEGDAGYEISTVLSAYWWDDMSWDFEVSDKQAARPGKKTASRKFPGVPAG
jgi:hypothetical protein